MPVHQFIRSFAGREFSVERVITFHRSALGPYEARKPLPKAEQNGCRQRLEGYLSCQQRLPLAVA
jgi:hypothetical protein